MHPVLFRIPLPKYQLPWTWLLLAVAAIALVVALVTFARKDRQGAVIPAAIAVAAGLGGLFLRGKAWDMDRIPIYSYGVMLGLSLVVGWYLTLGLAERDGLPKETMANNYVVTAIAAVVGSRVLYILTNLNEFDSFEKLFAMRQGGLVAYGGFLGGLLGSIVFLRRHKLPLLPWADVAVPSLASGLMITRIGCYLFGCDFGKPLSDSAPSWLKFLGKFPHWPKDTLDNGVGAPAWQQHTQQKWADFHHLPRLTDDSSYSYPVHPTQLYESAVGLFLLVLLLWARRHQKFRGEIFFLFFFAYGVCRYGLEIIRDDAERGEIPPSLPEQFLIPLGAAILAAGFVIGFSKAIKNVTLMRVAQVLSFLPAVLLYIALRPSGGFDNDVQYSTSQFIAITSGFAACVAFSVFYKAALAHPESAMALNLPAEGGEAKKVDDDDDDEDDDDEAPKAKPVAKKTAPKPAPKPAPKKAKPAAKDEQKQEDDDDEDDDDEDDDDGDDDDEEKPVAKKPAPKATKAAPAKKPAPAAKAKPKAQSAQQEQKKPAPKVEKDDEDEDDEES